jgi:Amt family ammonium transporter
VFKPIKPLMGLFVLWLIALATAAPAFAQGAGPDQAVALAQFLAASLVLLLPVGLILLISSAMPEAKAPAAAITLLMVWAIAALAYFGVGFAFHFGGIAQVSPDPDLRGLYWEWYPLDQSVDVELARLWGVIALRGWALAGEAATPGAFRLFLLHLALVGSVALIPAGALIQRGRKGSALLAALLIGILIYPVAGNWVWGGGWLSHLGNNLGLGHGFVDFGGAGLIFLTGTTIAVVALTLFQPVGGRQSSLSAGSEVIIVASKVERLTVYDETPAPAAADLPEFTPMPSAYLPLLSLLGGGLMLMGWFGLSSGSHLPTAVNFIPGQAAAAGLLAALAGALSAAGYSWFTTGEFNPLMTGRGLAAGLVVAIAGAPFMPVWISVIAGLITGAVLPPLIYLFSQRLRLADELGIASTYGLPAVLSLLLVALFADGWAGQGWNGTGLTDYREIAGQGVSGLLVGPGFRPDWPNQFHAQVLGVGIILLWTLLLSFLLFKTINVVNEAWTRTGLELVPRTSNPETRPADISKSPEEIEEAAASQEVTVGS